MSFIFHHPFSTTERYPKKVAYFCMEFGIHQPLKTYAGGLGFLAGSHMRSAFELKQPIVGIGILWKHGYYTQTRKPDHTMDVLFEEHHYGFLIPTDIRITIRVSGHPVTATAFYLPPDIFHTAPVFFLSTDLPENDYLAHTISHKLYDSNPETKTAAAILLGAGGVMLLEKLGWEPDVYHLNESHALPLAFYLYDRYKSPEKVKEKLVFTNHTPEEAGNQKSSVRFLEKMSFFCNVPQAELKLLTQDAVTQVDHTLTCLRLSKKANGVSALHRQTLCATWGEKDKTCPISSVTNAQNFSYWGDMELYDELKRNNNTTLQRIKKDRKRLLFDYVADQCGELFDVNICTLIFAKRFTGYKRPDIFFHQMDRFLQLLNHPTYPVQIIWAGKPYPVDYEQIGVFDKIVDFCKRHNGCAILTGYELGLSKLLKAGADVWLNIPRRTHEASGTSGISAAMNGAINVAIPDGWFPEFAKDKINSFVIPPSNTNLPEDLQDDQDAASLLDVLEKEVLPLYYDYPERWNQMMANSLHDIHPAFDSKRMADEYYDKLYSAE
jgi:starch phosphorylase